jgi:hypothetical protein
MSRYDELAASAVKASEIFYQDKRRCENCARHICGAVRSYFEAPPEAVKLVDLDAELRVAGEPHPKFIKLAMSADSRWYFGLHIHFESQESNAFQDVTLKIGLQSDGDNFRVHFEQDFKIDLNTAESLEGFADYIYRGLMEDFSKPMYSVRSRIGF